MSTERGGFSLPGPMCIFASRFRRKKEKVATVYSWVLLGAIVFLEVTLSYFAKRCNTTCANALVDGAMGKGMGMRMHHRSCTSPAVERKGP